MIYRPDLVKKANLDARLSTMYSIYAESVRNMANLNDNLKNSAYKYD